MSICHDHGLVPYRRALDLGTGHALRDLQVVREEAEVAVAFLLARKEVREALVAHSAVLVGSAQTIQ